jgi:rfaE bifunctional protein nucleotidyltransferase chain/domain
MRKRFWDLLKARGPWPKALMLAVVSDIFSSGLAFTGPMQLGVDLLTALAIFALLGLRWTLFIPIFIEAIPGLAVFPVWTLAIGAMMALEPKIDQHAKKILDATELAAEASRLKDAGLKLVFTNGVFDLLHVGHLRYLKAARELGDALAIGVNSDASVKILKGEQRPILPEAERAELLAALACVDYVCIFSEEDPRELIKAVVPSILVKGGDWPVDKILGADTVLAAGGKVLNLPFVEGRSTTSIVEGIRKRYVDGFKE